MKKNFPCEIYASGRSDREAEAAAAERTLRTLTLASFPLQ